MSQLMTCIVAVLCLKRQRIDLVDRQMKSFSLQLFTKGSQGRVRVVVVFENGARLSLD